MTYQFKHDYLITKQRHKILPVYLELIEFIKKEKIALCSISAMEILYNKTIHVKNPIYIVTIKEYKFFSDFFKILYKKYKFFFSNRRDGNITHVYLDLQPILIIEFVKSMSKIYYKDDFTFINPFYCLMDLYYKYGLIYDYINDFDNFIEIESKFIDNFIDNPYKDKFIKLYQNESIKQIDIKCNIKMDVFNDILKTGKCMLTGYYAYLLLDNTIPITDILYPIEIVCVDIDEIIKTLSEYEFNDIENNNGKYFRRIMKCHNVILYEYNRPVICNYIHEIYVGNYHNILFHMLYNNIYYGVEGFKTILHNIKTNHINVLEKGYYQVFQNDVLQDSVITMLRKITHNFYYIKS